MISAIYCGASKPNKDITTGGYTVQALLCVYVLLRYKSTEEPYKRNLISIYWVVMTQVNSSENYGFGSRKENSSLGKE